MIVLPSSLHYATNMPNLPTRRTATSLAECQNDLELDFKVFFFVDSCCLGIVLEESN